MISIFFNQAVWFLLFYKMWKFQISGILLCAGLTDSPNFRVWPILPTNTIVKVLADQGNISPPLPPRKGHRQRFFGAMLPWTPSVMSSTEMYGVGEWAKTKLMRCQLLLLMDEGCCWPEGPLYTFPHQISSGLIRLPLLIPGHLSSSTWQCCLL